MVFIPRTVFARNARSIYAIVVEERTFLINYPFLYENKKELYKFKEKRFIMR